MVVYSLQTQNHEPTLGLFPTSYSLANNYIFVTTFNLFSNYFL